MDASTAESNGCEAKQYPSSRTGDMCSRISCLFSQAIPEGILSHLTKRMENCSLDWHTVNKYSSVAVMVDSGYSVYVLSTKCTHLPRFGHSSLQMHDLYYQKKKRATVTQGCHPCTCHLVSVFLYYENLFFACYLVNQFIQYLSASHTRTTGLNPGTFHPIAQSTKRQQRLKKNSLLI